MPEKMTEKRVHRRDAEDAEKREISAWKLGRRIESVRQGKEVRLRS
jgi:hypothetical protein